MIQGRFAGMPARSRAIDGSATFVTDPSMKARLEASMVAAIVQHGWAISRPVRSVPLIGNTVGKGDSVGHRLQMHGLHDHVDTKARCLLCNCSQPW